MINIFKKKKGVDKIPVLAFHRVVPNDDKWEVYPTDEWKASDKIFDEMMKYISDSGYRTLSLDEFYEWYTGKVDYNEKVCVLTFDDGYIDNYYFAYPILKKYNLKGCFFTVGCEIKDNTENYTPKNEYHIGLDKMEELKRDYPNIEFQSHTWDCHRRVDGIERILTLNEEELIDDCKKMRDNFKFDYMAYPYGKRNDLVKKVMKDTGFKLAFRFGPPDYAYRDSDQFAVPRIKVNGNVGLDYLKKYLP